MILKIGAKAALHSIGALLCLAASTAYGGPIHYAFTGTTLPSGGLPGHSQVFELTLPDFLPVVSGGPVVEFVSTDPAVISCIPCTNPPDPALFFLRGGIGDSVQFQDQNGTGYIYFFPADVLTTVGTHQTLPGINVNTGTLSVAAIPEPSTAGMLILGVLFLRRARRKR